GVVIPNYNGEAFIAKTVVAAIQALERLEVPGKIYVVDDASKDQSVKVLQENFGEHPSVCIIERSKNGSFSEACWTGAQANVYSAILFLNSDVQMCPDALAEFWREFARPGNENVFAITGSYINEKEEPVLEVLNRGLFHMGLLRTRSTDDIALRSKTTRHLYANGGFSLFNTQRFIQLGGFSLLYKPFYVEDFDLSLRALRMGYHNLYLPTAKGLHENSKTIKKYFTVSQVKEITLVNRFLLVWTHMDSAQLWVRHILAIMCRNLGALLTADGIYLRALTKALRKTDEVVRERKKIGATKIPLLTVLEQTASWDPDR
ncbi:MAG: glycosyltransferase family 2 protein, partial [Nitrospinaceae bacterium]